MPKINGNALFQFQKSRVNKKIIKKGKIQRAFFLFQTILIFLSKKTFPGCKGWKSLKTMPLY